MTNHTFRPVVSTFLIVMLLITQVAWPQQVTPNSPAKQQEGQNSWRPYADAIVSNTSDDYQKSEARESLASLPLEQRKEALLYVLKNTSDSAWQFTVAQEVLFLSPTEDTINIVFPWFSKSPTETKTEIAMDSLGDLCLLYPDVAGFRKMARFSLQESISKAKSQESAYNVGVMSIILCYNAEQVDKDLLHKALLKYPNSTGVWNALTLINDLSAAEKAKAIQLFQTTKETGLKLSVAAALVPYNVSAKAYVIRVLTAQITNAQSPSNSQPLDRTLKSGVHPLPEVKIPRLDALPILRFVSEDVSRPFVVKILHSPNVWLSKIADPILAIRFPAQLLEQTKTEKDRAGFVNYTGAMALAAILHPSYKARIQQRLGTQELEDGMIVLREQGILIAF